MSKKFKITQIKSSIRRLSAQKITLKALGLRGINRSVIHVATPSILGMISKVSHLVRTEEVQ